ncbi:MAG: Tim44-like domain-containing protein [Rhodocyclaceae bacterium]|nr:Tim44-like domain-containing protein [Rhodocyclaceae bacterium]
MKLSLITLITAATTFIGLGIASTEAEAKRMGGGTSTGMSRSATPPPAQAVPPKTATAAPAAAAPAAAAAAAPKRNWLGPIAGLAAGLGIAALLSHFGMGEGVANFLMIALLVFAGIFLVRFLMRRFMGQGGPQLSAAGNSAGRVEPMRFEAANSASGEMASAKVGVGGTATAAHIPADFDTEGFLRQAKLNFIRLQAANDRGDMDDIKSFTSPEVFAEVQMQYRERGNAPQVTDVAQLDAAVIEVVTENNQHIVSVHFSGLISEEAGSAPAPFAEIWHLTKPVDGSRGWLIAGIQQVA